MFLVKYSIIRADCQYFLKKEILLWIIAICIDRAGCAQDPAVLIVQQVRSVSANPRQYREFHARHSTFGKNLSFRVRGVQEQFSSPDARLDVSSVKTGKYHVQPWGERLVTEN